MVYRLANKSRVALECMGSAILVAALSIVTSCEASERVIDMDPLKHPKRVASNSKGLFLALHIDGRLSIVNFAPEDESARVVLKGSLDAYSPSICHDNLFYMESDSSGTYLVKSSMNAPLSSSRHSLNGSLDYLPSINCETIYLTRRSAWDVETYIRLYSLDLSDGSTDLLKKASLLSLLDVSDNELYLSYNELNQTKVCRMRNGEAEEIFGFPDTLYAHDFDADSGLLVFAQTDTTYSSSIINIYDYKTKTISTIHSGGLVSSLNFGENGEIVAVTTNSEKIPVSILYIGKNEVGYDQAREFDLKKVLELVR